MLEEFEQSTNLWDTKCTKMLKCSALCKTLILNLPNCLRQSQDTAVFVFVLFERISSLCNTE